MTIDFPSDVECSLLAVRVGRVSIERTADHGEFMWESHCYSPDIRVRRFKTLDDAITHARTFSVTADRIEAQIDDCNTALDTAWETTE